MRSHYECIEHLQPSVGLQLERVITITVPPVSVALCCLGSGRFLHSLLT